MNNDYTEIGAIVAITLGAFELIKFLFNKWTNNGTQRIKKQIDDLKDNHFHELQDTLSRVDKRTEEMNGKLIQIVELLKLISQRK